MSKPSIFNDPPVGLSMPAIRFSSVVLPLPLGPMSARKVPRSTSRSSPSRGRITFSPRWYSRVSPRHSMNAIAASLHARRLYFAVDADAVAFFEPLGLGDELIARRQAGGDGNPAFLPDRSELNLPPPRHALAAVGHPHR